MAKTCTILGPYAQADFNDSTKRAAVQTAIVSAIGGNTPVSADPHVILGNIYVFVTTS
tara:strand:- start:618 stop:791 length:174 start_codon:yes stop_codon:yes gene_type:complete